MNKLLAYMIKQRNGHYIHALELHGVYDFESTIENFIGELQNEFTKEDFKEFFNSMSIYHLTDDEITEEENELEEQKLYDFDVDSFIDELY